MTGICFQNFDTPRGDLIRKVAGGENHCFLIDGDEAIESLVDVAILPAECALGRSEEAWIFSTGSQKMDQEVFEAAKSFIGTPYDASYDFDGPDMFCSKLAWLAIREVGHFVPEPILLSGLNWKPYTNRIAIEAAKYGLTLEQALSRRTITPKQIRDCLIEIDYYM